MHALRIEPCKFGERTLAGKFENKHILRFYRFQNTYFRICGPYLDANSPNATRLPS